MEGLWSWDLTKIVRVNQRVDSLEKDYDAGRDWGQEEKGTTEDELAGWHHWLDGRESEWTAGVGDGQGGPACCDSRGRKESDTTERLIWSDLFSFSFISKFYIIPNKWICCILCKHRASLGIYVFSIFLLSLLMLLWISVCLEGFSSFRISLTVMPTNAKGYELFPG